ncbi:hypothetical protein, partial [Pseudomonas arcuscaelestis]|uniref:hypothetical protein n=1 Tax=Pseudomonas arcuscaelestis TaxID=2710591 RepID=UPI00193ECDD5
APAFAAIAAGNFAALTATGVSAMTAASLGAVSLASGAAGTLLEATGKDAKAAGILGWVSLGSGLVGAALEMLPKAIAGFATRVNRFTGRGASKLGGSVGRTSGSGATHSAVSLDAARTQHVYPMYRDNYLGQDLAAFATHGSAGGKLLSATGRMEDAVDVARIDIGLWLNRINYEEGKGIVLLACEGGSSGAAQTIANQLKRPVQAYDKRIFVLSPHSREKLVISDKYLENTLPTERLSRWKRVRGQRSPFEDKASRRYAPSRLYFPGH